MSLPTWYRPYTDVAKAKREAKERYMWQTSCMVCGACPVSIDTIDWDNALCDRHLRLQKEDSEKMEDRLDRNIIASNILDRLDRLDRLNSMIALTLLNRLQQHLHYFLAVPVLIMLALFIYDIYFFFSTGGSPPLKFNVPKWGGLVCLAFIWCSIPVNYILYRFQMREIKKKYNKEFDDIKEQQQDVNKTKIKRNDPLDHSKDSDPDSSEATPVSRDRIAPDTQGDKDEDSV